LKPAWKLQEYGNQKASCVSEGVVSEQSTVEFFWKLLAVNA
jgi:hypothetical protein